VDWLRRAADSHWSFRLLLALPAIVMLSDFALSGGNVGRLLQPSGEWAARLLIVTLAVTPVRMIFKGRHWPMWLFKRRRDLGLAAFLYALLHVASYLIRQSNLHVVLYDLHDKAYVTGWFAFAVMLALAASSNDATLHGLGPWWKTLQRLVYLAALAVFLHWFWMKLDHRAVWLHFIPLVLLEAWRVLHSVLRSRRAV
jgi:methionine sulfoxide reductase heme-binding subunit